MPGEWDTEVENWLQWARTPGFDAYWYYRDAFFGSVLPARRGQTLEIGCGEGRVARDLTKLGYLVTALDSATGLVRHASEADTMGNYLVGEGTRLPVREASFDLVVAYNALQVVDDMAQTVKESARALRSGGHLCICIAHPVTDMGQWVDIQETAAFVVRVPYFARARVEDTVEKDGIRMTFRGWTYTLEDYSVALEDAGFAIEAIREPKPASDSRYQQWREVPLFMNVGPSSDSESAPLPRFRPRIRPDRGFGAESGGCGRWERPSGGRSRRTSPARTTSYPCSCARGCRVHAWSCGRGGTPAGWAAGRRRMGGVG